MNLPEALIPNSRSLIQKPFDEESQNLYRQMLKLQNDLSKINNLTQALEIHQKTFDFKYTFQEIYQRLSKGLWTEADEKMYMDNLWSQQKAKEAKRGKLSIESAFYLLREGRDLSLYI
jgi:hypothetical protein